MISALARNERLARAIDQAIKERELRGRAPTAKLLLEQGVPVRVIARILTPDARRRVKSR